MSKLSKPSNLSSTLQKPSNQTPLLLVDPDQPTKLSPQKSTQATSNQSTKRKRLDQPTDQIDDLDGEISIEDCDDLDSEISIEDCDDLDSEISTEDCDDLT